MLLRNALLALVLALLVPLPAAAESAAAAPADGNDKSEGGEEGEEEVPAEPPPTPRKLKKAIKQLKNKDWALATLSLRAVLDDPEAEYFHGDVRYYLSNALEQLGLNYSALEAYNNFLEGASSESKLLAKGIKRSVSLARQMEAGWIVASGLAKLDTSVVSAGYRGPAMAWVGRHHYENRNFAAAKAYLSLVPKDTEYYAEARMLEGITLTREKKAVEAIAPLAAAVVATKNDSTATRVSEVSNLNLARAYYAIGNYERAIEHFERIPRDSPLWFEALYEASWSYFRAGRLSGALSHLQSVDSPFFKGVYHPDATLLRILIFYYLCKYIDGQEMLKEFTETHYPIAKELETAVAEAEKRPTSLFQSLYAWKTARKDKGLPLPESVKQYFATDENLASVGDYIAGIDAELEAMSKIRTGWERSALKKELEQELKDRRKAATDNKGKQALLKLRVMLVTLNGHLGNSELYKVEMISAEKSIYDAAFQGRLLDRIAARKLDLQVPEGFRYWPFEGEYWVDELGWYEVNTINECLRIQK